MVEQEIKKILESTTIPEPDENAKKRTIQAAMAEFEQQKAVAEKKIKGIEFERRPTDRLFNKLKLFGGIIMKKFYLYSGAVAAIFIVLLYGVYETSHFSKNSQLESEHTTQPVMETMETAAVSKEALPAEPEAEYEEALVEGESEKMMVDEVAAMPEPVVTQSQPLAKRKIAKGVRSMKLESRPVMPVTPNPAVTFVLPEEEIAPQPPKEVGRDRFEELKANPVKLVSQEPVSTFSVDVDTAAYAFVRKMINQGRLPQKNAVRIEELINYFDYDYTLPEDRSRPFQPTVAVYPTPWNEKTKLLHIGIKGYDIVPTQKPKSNLVFLLDVSGSMSSPDKLPLLKNSFRMLVNSLEKDDTVAIVVYAGAAGTVLEPTKVSQKGKILAALDRLQAGGSTAGGEGIRQAYALAESNFDKQGVNRVILATDGDFNVGITNMEELKGFVERKRETGIYLSVLGFGQGNYNDHMMQALAQNGNGNAAYIDSLNEARKVLVDEAHSTLFPIAKDVKIQIEFNPKKVAEYRLIGYETRMLKREDFKNDKVDAGDIGSGHTVTAIYEITAPDSDARLIDDLRYNKAEKSKKPASSLEKEFGFLKIRYKLPKESKSRLITTPITLKQEYRSFGKVPVDLRFAAAVAAYAQILRGDPYTKNFSYDQVIQLVSSARGQDNFGFRNEFMNLVRLTKTASPM